MNNIEFPQIGAENLVNPELQSRPYPYDAILVFGGANNVSNHIQKKYYSHEYATENYSRKIDSVETKGEPIERGGNAEEPRDLSELEEAGLFGLSPIARRRLLTAVQAYKLGLAPRIVVTGGPTWLEKEERYDNGKPVIRSENDATTTEEKRYIHAIPHSILMRNALIKMGIPEEVILCEEKSIKTTDNIAEAINILGVNGLESKRFVLVSSSFHFERIIDDIRRFGISEYLPLSGELGLLLKYLESDRIDRKSGHESGGNSSLQDAWSQATLEMFGKDKSIARRKKATFIANEILGHNLTEHAPEVWLSLMLTLEDQELLRDIFAKIKIASSSENWGKWRRTVCQKAALPETTSDEQLIELITHKRISPLQLRVSRLRQTPEYEEQQRLIDFLENNPELIHEEIDIPGAILALSERGDLLQHFLNNPIYHTEIEQWWEKNRALLMNLPDYQSFCDALLSGHIDRQLILHTWQIPIKAYRELYMEPSSVK